jgi:hypothetical protein
MNKLLLQVILVACASCAGAQTNSSFAHRWKATVTVLDVGGQPVPGATVVVSYYVQPPPGRPGAGEQIEGVTDTNGVFTASHSDTTIGLGFLATKPGYYPTSKGYEFGLPFDYNPIKWSPSITLVLKTIGNPIPMYVKREETKVQKENEPVGFDLMAADWVAPYGKGVTSDFLFAVHRRIINQREYDGEVKLSFPNKGDGIVITPPEPDTGSELRTARTATESGYLPERVWHYSTHSGPESLFGYFFRVRTVLDGDGQVKTALYGKIQGDIRFYAGTIAPRAGIGFTYYLNPTPNDRNVEFDPKQNLFEHLSPNEEVREP